MTHHFIYLVFIVCTISHVYSSAVLPTVTRNRIQPEKLSIVTEWNEYNMRETDGPGTYSFGYDVEDAETGNIQFRSEEKLANGSVIGSYGYVTPEGNVHMVHYVADHLGYRTKIEDGRKPLIKNNFLKSNQISPQMNAALESLENYSRYQNIQEQPVRPIDKVPYMNNKQQLIKQTENSENNYAQKKNGFYNVYYVPANMIYN